MHVEHVHLFDLVAAAVSDAGLTAKNDDATCGLADAAAAVSTVSSGRFEVVVVVLVEEAEGAGALQQTHLAIEASLGTRHEEHVHFALLGALGGAAGSCWSCCWAVTCAVLLLLLLCGCCCRC